MRGSECPCHCRLPQKWALADLGSPDSRYSVRPREIEKHADAYPHNKHHTLTPTTFLNSTDVGPIKYSKGRTRIDANSYDKIQRIGEYLLFHPQMSP